MLIEENRGSLSNGKSSIGDGGKVKGAGCQDNSWEVWCIILNKVPPRKSSKESLREANNILLRDILGDPLRNP